MIRVWELSQIYDENYKPFSVRGYRNYEVNSVAWSPGGSFIAAGLGEPEEGEDGRINIYKVIYK